MHVQDEGPHGDVKLPWHAGLEETRVLDGLSLREIRQGVAGRLSYLSAAR